MELQHRLIRQTIHIAVSKAMEDMQSNTKRSIRNLIDLGLLFAKSENQKWFYSAAKKVIANPQNPYNSFAARMLANVDNDTVKTVGLNLGYNSLTYGAEKLKKRQDDLGFPVPWFLIFEFCESGPDFFQQMERLIMEGRELGIYSYIACPREKDDMKAICEIAERFEDCLFIIKATSDLITEQTAEMLGKMRNAMISIQMSDKPLCCENNVNAFHLLKENRCLYGFHVSYNESTAERVTAPGYIDAAIGLGNLFGVYIAENGVSPICRNSVYAFACHTRGANGRPLVTMEWDRDIQNISEKILSGDSGGTLDLAQRIYGEYVKTKEMLAHSLLEILQKINPRTSC